MLGFSLNLHAADDPCKNEAAGAKGVCRAYWNSCKDGDGDRVNCARLRELWTEKTGRLYFPWETPPPPPVTCPCENGGDAQYTAVVSGSTLTDCNKFTGNQIFVWTNNNCQAGVVNNAGTFYCAASCSATLIGSLQITPEQAAKCYLNLEALSDSQGVTCYNVAQ